MSFCSGTTTSDNRYQVIYQSWRLNFRTIEPVLHSSRWVEAVEEAVAERPIQVYLHWKEVLLLVIVDIKWVVELN